ncbi:MAG: ATP-binding protein [Thermoguttaceae bacterium]
MAGLSEKGEPASELILVVEDDAGLRRLIEKSLAAHGHRPMGAADGASALACLAGNAPRLMLLDYSLPDMHGQQLLERIAAQGKNVPFVVATGHGSESVAVEMMKRGAYDYLVKGPTFMQLLPVVVAQALERVRQAERLVEAEERLRRAHEELEHRVRLRTSELADALQRLRVEMEERRRAEDRAIRHQAELAHVARLSTVGEMVAELTHELNQPLSAICSHVQACRRLMDAGDEQRQELSASLRQVGEQADRAAEIIRRLRRFVAKGKPLRAPLNLNAMIQDVSGLLGIDARTAGTDMAFDLADSLPPVSGDKIQLEQVLVNLVRNAFDSLQQSPTGARRVCIRTQSNAAQVVVAVEDNGAGLTPEVARFVFDRFFTTKPDGMGMGLSISRSIVENHGGRLWVTPARGGGAVFQFALPIDRGEPSRGK